MPDEYNSYQTGQQPLQPQSAVWPPAPNVNAAPDQPAVPYLPFLYKYNRVEGKINDFREGVIGVRPDGFTIDGKGLGDPYLRILVRVGIGYLGSYLMRNTLYKPMSIFIPTQDILKVTLETKKRRAGIAYTQLNKKGKPVVYSFCFQLVPDAFQVFSSWAAHVVPEKSSEGRLKSGTTPATILAIFIIYILLFSLIGLASYFSTSTH